MTLQEITDTFAFFDDWEDRYRFILELGKDLEELSPADRTDANLVRGCQSQVWLTCKTHADGRLHLRMDSDAHIVRGLISIVLTALNDKLPREILEFDIEQVFAELDLMQHLSQTRGNGLRAMLERIRHEAAHAA